MDFELLERVLGKTFQLGYDEIDYFGKNIQTGLLEYSVKLKNFTPELNSRWAKNFPSGSYFSISKESQSNYLTLIVTISENDYKAYFYFKQPKLKISNGVIMNPQDIKK